MTIARAKHARAARRPRTTAASPRAGNGDLPVAKCQVPEFKEAKLAIRDAKDEIVHNLIEKAKEGSYLHAKFLFDFAGLSNDAAVEAYEREGSLARILLDQLSSEGIAVPGYSAATAQPPRESV
jgi:hypothetical protein